MGQPHEVRLSNGAKINWKHPPKANEVCRWTKETSGGKVIKGGFRTLCHFNRLNNLAIKKYDTQLTIFQGCFNSSVAASAGTHDKDSCMDWYIPGVGWWDTQKFGRKNGCACWYRHAPLFSNHVHGFTLPPHSGNPADDFKVAGIKVGKFIDGGLSTVGHVVGSSQITDYYNHAFALAGKHAKGSDKSWFPANIGATIFDLSDYVARRAA